MNTSHIKTALLKEIKNAKLSVRQLTSGRISVTVMQSSVFPNNYRAERVDLASLSNERQSELISDIESALIRSGDKTGFHALSFDYEINVGRENNLHKKGCVMG